MNNISVASVKFMIGFVVMMLYSSCGRQDSAAKMHHSKGDQEKPKLPSLDMEGVAAYIKEKSPKNVIFMVGAGISTAAGMPDFRSPGTGLYDNLSRFRLPDPTAICDIGFFKKDPEPFYVFAKGLFMATENAKPTLAHYFIRLVEEKGLLRRCFSQNVDLLEYAAGIKEEKIIAAHGSYQTSHCQQISCRKKFDKEWLIAHFRNNKNVIPKCDACQNVVKPDIIFFGENLPPHFSIAASADFSKCDLLIVMGTSLQVKPFASMIEKVPKDTPRFLINLTAGGPFLQHNGNARDVFWEGKCDDGVKKLAKLLGWESELNALFGKQ